MYLNKRVSADVIKHIMKFIPLFWIRWCCNMHMSIPYICDIQIQNPNSLIIGDHEKNAKIYVKTLRIKYVNQDGRNLYIT